jgi:hypothetical protein
MKKNENPASGNLQILEPTTNEENRARILNESLTCYFSVYKKIFEIEKLRIFPR